VVATVSSEFIGCLEAVESICQLLNAGSIYHVPPVSQKALLDIIEKPAQLTGHVFEVGLVEEIMRDAAQEPGNLPLVSYALKQLFENRRDTTFTRGAYLTIGRVAGAIGTKADQVMKDVDKEVAGAFDKIFARLVHIDRERPPTRRRASLAAFKTDKAAKDLIEALSGKNCRVLVKSGNKKDQVVEVAHEKLFTAWPQLEKWINNSTEALQLIKHAEEEALTWWNDGSSTEDLWRGTRAKKVLSALERFSKDPEPVLRRFLMPQPVLIEQLDQHRLSHGKRLLIGHKLAEFGDPRPGVGLRPEGLPDIAWIDIPGGKSNWRESIICSR
jgi:hypothetical protein